MPRSGMTALIARLRRMADDGRSPQQFTDDDLQDILDTHRLRLPGFPLKADWQEAPPPRAEQFGYDQPIFWVGYQERKVWRSDYPYLESDCTLRDALGNTLDPATYTANYMGGEFTFMASQDNIMYLWGHAYDVNAAAADAWSQKSANTSLWKGQFAQTADMQIKRYQRLAWGHNGTQTRV